MKRVYRVNLSVTGGINMYVEAKSEEEAWKAVNTAYRNGEIEPYTDEYDLCAEEDNEKPEYYVDENGELREVENDE